MLTKQGEEILTWSKVPFERTGNIVLVKHKEKGLQLFGGARKTLWALAKFFDLEPGDAVVNVWQSNSIGPRNTGPRKPKEKT